MLNIIITEIGSLSSVVNEVDLNEKVIATMDYAQIFLRRLLGT